MQMKAHSSSEVIAEKDLKFLCFEQYKHWETGLITTGFEFDTDRIKGKEGFPLEAENIATAKSFKTWTQDAVAQDCEYRVIKMLERILSKEVAILITLIR